MTVAAVVMSVLAVATAGAVLVSGEGNASIQADPPSAASLAAAIAQNPSVVTGASYVTIPPGGNPVAVSTQSLGSFPRSGETYAILTTGDAALAGGTQEEFASIGAGGGAVEGRGDTARDITVLKIDLSVPETANCLAFDFRFLSEEFDLFVGTTYNDAFIAELDQSDWTTSGSTITATRNFAFDAAHNVISINATGAAGMSFEEGAGTIYDGATPLLSASTPITPGTHSLFLSIFDQGDAAYDSAVFVDRLVLSTASPGGCVAGATTLSAAIAADEPESLAGATNGYTVTISNSGGTTATLESISALLPDGFSYVEGSTTGVTTTEPTANGQTLTWSGSFPVAGDGSTSLHFQVVVADTPGSYTAAASGAGTGVSVTPSGASAPITVTEPSGLADLAAAIAADQAESAPGATNGYTITISNPNSDQATLSSISAALPAGFSYVAGSTTGAATGDPSVEGQTLTWNGSFPVDGDGSSSLHFEVVVSDAPGTYTAQASAAGEGITVTPSGPSASITVSEVAEPGTIESAGPLSLIQISSQLNCNVQHVDDEFPEFFDGTACGTFVALGETLFGPEEVPAGPSPTPFTPVSQTPASGSGTAADPYRVVTVVDLGETGLRIEQTDSYVVGDESYRTDIVVRNLGGQSQNVILYRAGDCFLAESDSGFGSVDPGTGAVACIGVDETGAAPGTRIEQWVPLTSGSAYYEASFGDVWSQIEGLQPFPNTCRCNERIDNGSGLSWQLTIPAEGSVTASHLTRFSPTGNVPQAPPAPEAPAPANLILTMFASTPTAAVGDPIGFAGNVTNHGPGPAYDVTVVGTVSETVQLDSASTDAGPCTVSGNAFTCSIGTLLHGGSATVTLTGTVVAAGGALATMSTDAAQTDPDESNNSASASIASPAPPPPPGVFQPPVADELPPPERGVAVNVTPLRGTVLVNGVRLREGEQIPVGAIVDTRRGRVRLQSASGTAAFKDGLFRIVESPGGAFTELRLLGGNFLRACGRPARLLSLSNGLEARRKRVVRRLWGNGSGNFRTSGRFSSATVRGTIWLTADRCDGTLTRVLRGRVSVLDFAKKRRILLRPGRSYLAPAPK